MHENPRGFTGFRASPAAFLLDGVQNNRTHPDWYHAHAKRQEKLAWERRRLDAVADDNTLRARYDVERAQALKRLLDSAEGRQHYDQAFHAYLELFRVTEPHRFEQAAREAATERIQRIDLAFPAFELWSASQVTSIPETVA